MSGLLKSLLFTPSRAASVSLPPTPALTGPNAVPVQGIELSVVHAIRYGVLNLSFYAAGRHWIFYSHQTGAPAFAPRVYYRSSADNGATWTARTIIGEWDGSGMVAAIFDGTYLHYVRIRSQALFYRRGTPDALGAIAWSAVEQTVYDNAPTGGMLHPSIAVLSGGYPAISYNRDDGAAYLPRVIISDNTDGTWSGAEVETTLGGPNDVSWGTSLHTLGAGLYVLYGRDNENILGQEYSAGAWQGEEDTGYDTVGGVTWSATTKNGEIHVAYVDDTDRDIYHGYRNAGGAWQARVSVQTGTYTNSTAQIVSLGAPSLLYIIWPETADDTIHYKLSMTNGATWGTDTLVFTSPAALTSGQDLQAYETIMSNHIGIMWLTAAGAPYTLYFGDMDFT